MLYLSNDNWQSSMRISDKVLHFAGFFSIIFFTKAFVNLNILILLGWAAFGVLWEVAECKFADGFSWRDLTADFLGIGTAYLMLLKGTYFIVGFSICVAVYFGWNWKVLIEKE